MKFFMFHLFAISCSYSMFSSFFVFSVISEIMSDFLSSGILSFGVTKAKAVCLGSGDLCYDSDLLIESR